VDLEKTPKISWTEHKTNEEVGLLKAMDEERVYAAMSTLRRQKNWIGHVELRRNSLLRTVVEGRMKGKKVPGRQEVKEKAKNRQEWNGTIEIPDLSEKAENPRIS